MARALSPFRSARLLEAFQPAPVLRLRRWTFLYETDAQEPLTKAQLASHSGSAEEDKANLQFLYDEWAHPHFGSFEEDMRMMESTGEMEQVVVRASHCIS